MNKSVVYDKAKFHYDGDYPRGLPIEQAFVHTGMFVGWVIERGLYSDDFQAMLGPAIEAFKERELTGAKVYEEMDGAFTDQDLSDEGDAFAQYYFDFDKGKYLEDYERILVLGLPSIYHVSDTWENYDNIKQRIDQRYIEWKKKRNG